jgi:hypothetical protein
MLSAARTSKLRFRAQCGTESARLQVRHLELAAQFNMAPIWAGDRDHTARALLTLLRLAATYLMGGNEP